VGINFPINLRVGSDVRISGCFANLLNITAKCSADFFYYDETVTNRMIGVGLRATGFLSGGGLNWQNLVSTAICTGGVTLGGLTQNNFSNGSFVTGGGLTLAALVLDVTTNPANIQPFNIIGGKCANAASPVRVFGSSIGPDGLSAGITINYSSFTFGRVIVQNQGANPCLKVFGQSRFSISNQFSGSIGNTDVGLDLTRSVGSTIIIASLPTVTGTAGDVRLSDGTIISWAIAMSGVVDPSGNVLCGLASSPLHYTPVATGSITVAFTNAPAGSAATPLRYVKIPDGEGGFFTFGSLT
jgi:hypothetical protein